MRAIALVLALGMAFWFAPVQAGEPCCTITAIDTASKAVTAKETKTGRTFQFNVTDARTLGTVRIGQPVHADFKTMKVSLTPDGATPCCAIVNLRAPGSSRVR